MGNLSPNFYPARNGKDYTGGNVQGKPLIIVLHLTEGSFQGAKGWLCNPASQASCTRLFARDGSSVELVAESDAPWTNGFAVNQEAPPTNEYVRQMFWDGEYAGERMSPNLCSLTVEIEWFQSDGIIPIDTPLYAALVAQVADWSYRYGIPPTRERIMGHYEITPAEKPFCGKHIPWQYFIPDVTEAVKLKTPKPAAASPWHEADWRQAIQLGITDGTNPQGTLTREQGVSLLMRALRQINPKKFAQKP